MVSAVQCSAVQCSAVRQYVVAQCTKAEDILIQYKTEQYISIQCLQYDTVKILVALPFVLGPGPSGRKLVQDL